MPKPNPFHGEHAQDLLDDLFDDEHASQPIEAPEWWQGGEQFTDQTPRVSRQRYWFDGAPNAVSGRDARDPMDMRPRGRAGEVVGQMFWTPAMIADYMRQTQAQFAAVNADYKAAAATGKLPPATRDAWNAFAASWQAFYKSDATSWFGGTVDRAEDYRRQLVTWRDKVAQYITPSSPVPHIEPSGSLFGGFGGGLGVGALLAVGVIVYLVSKK